VGVELGNKLVSATPSGNFLMFDVNRGRFGEWGTIAILRV
jgi:hypothetical protein